MAFSTVTYTVPTPVVTVYTIPFEFLREGNISVEVNGTAAGVTFTIDPSWDELTVTAPVLIAGDLVTITRTTPLTDSGQYVSFEGAAAPRRDDLETFRKQHLYALQEASDNSTSGLQLDLADSKWDAEGRIIKDVLDPVNDQDAATKLWVETAFSTGGVLPTPDVSKALYFVRVNSAGTGYVLSTSLAERYIYRIASQGSGPAGAVPGWVLPAWASGFANDTSQRAPLTLVDEFGDIGQVTLSVDTLELTVGTGQWEIEVYGHLRGLTDTGNVINETGGQLAITNFDASVVYAESPEVRTGFGIEVQDSGAAIPKHIPMSSMTTVRYLANFLSPTIINLRGRGTTSSHSVVADVPSYLRIQRIIR